jgi:hypothetical protein
MKNIKYSRLLSDVISPVISLATYASDLLTPPDGEIHLSLALDRPLQKIMLDSVHSPAVAECLG